MDPKVAWQMVREGGLVGLLLFNIFALLRLTNFVFKSLMNKEWVPGPFYKDVITERDRLRAENDAYRSVTLRAVGVTERAVTEQPIVSGR